MWDTAGQEKLAVMVKNFYQRCDGILLCFDVSNEASFESIRRWVKQIEENAKEDVLVILLGNKYDLPPEDHRVSRKEINRISHEFSFRFFETSAKMGKGVKEAINELAEMIYAQKAEKLETFSKGGGGGERFSLRERSK